MPPPRHSATERPAGAWEAAVRQAERPARLPRAPHALCFLVVQALFALPWPVLHTKLVMSRDVSEVARSLVLLNHGRPPSLLPARPDGPLASESTITVVMYSFPPWISTCLSAVASAVL
eukprot:4702112-Pyramimonas_sp.AAC.1